jgi:predicted membrane protein
MSKDKAIFGFVLILVGTALLLRQLDIFPFFFPHFLFTWPMILIIIGLAQIASKPEKTGGLIVLGIGTLFLIKEINHHFNPFSWWPIFLILAGLGILFKKKNTVSHSNLHRNSTGERSMDEVAIFSGGERIINTSNFSGGKVTTIFGGYEINLLNAELAPGQNVIDVFAAFGGVTFYVPPDWKVRTEVSAIFGAFSDERVVSKSAPMESDRELLIRGTVVFGGGDIKNR